MFSRALFPVFALFLCFAIEGTARTVKVYLRITPQTPIAGRFVFVNCTYDLRGNKFVRATLLKNEVPLYDLVAGKKCVNETSRMAPGDTTVWTVLCNDNALVMITMVPLESRGRYVCEVEAKGSKIVKVTRNLHVYNEFDPLLKTSTNAEPNEAESEDDEKTEENASVEPIVSKSRIFDKNEDKKKKADPSVQLAVSRFESRVANKSEVLSTADNRNGESSVAEELIKSPISHSTSYNLLVNIYLILLCIIPILDL